MTQPFFSFDKQSLGKIDLLLGQNLMTMMVLEEMFKITFRNALYNVTRGFFVNMLVLQPFYLDQNVLRHIFV